MRVMEIATERLAHAYHHRRCHFVSEERIGDWRLKLYALARPDQGVRDELIETTRALAAEALPEVDEAHHGAAFAIAHDARWPIALIYWWEGENEIHSAIYAGAEPTELAPAGPDAMGCVWELGVVEHERRAWIEDVIGNPDGPDLDAYMARRFEGMV
jgi:hypothetical protein